MIVVWRSRDQVYKNRIPVISIPGIRGEIDPELAQILLIFIAKCANPNNHRTLSQSTRGRI